ncbi:uncharacterized protein LOC126601996 isoform X2 [Malus sylvestris]|uniref:uncharacterized protein LOC126601996 isoform X2 n=1 Tax=Malus sylvestris TaxID=3752 RepID=UPI0010AAB831|nr:uncharacterized protein LOC103432315 isoform X2 [Malus domestica]XP_050124745.1 uncharacterized protein LOC126601996 isoform X2 [Malus sylvestris]
MVTLFWRFTMRRFMICCRAMAAEDSGLDGQRAMAPILSVDLVKRHVLAKIGGNCSSSKVWKLRMLKNERKVKYMNQLQSKVCLFQTQLSFLLLDFGLNVREVHVLSTTDGYSLDVFVVDGWSVEVVFVLGQHFPPSICTGMTAF